MRFNLDNTWIPEYPFECINATVVTSNHQCEGCVMHDHITKTLYFSKSENRIIELVDRESCIWYKKLIEANTFYNEIKRINVVIKDIHDLTEHKL